MALPSSILYPFGTSGNATDRYLAQEYRPRIKKIGLELKDIDEAAVW
jgi:hypothetical protein